MSRDLKFKHGDNVTINHLFFKGFTGRVVDCDEKVGKVTNYLVEWKTKEETGVRYFRASELEERD